MQSPGDTLCMVKEKQPAQGRCAPDCSICLNSLGTAAGLTRRMQASMRVLKVSTVGITPSLPISVSMPKASFTTKMFQFSKSRLAHNFVAYKQRYVSP